ncbi:MAG: Gldg family protein [Roseburia sp.]|nr:Gldg family protein [Roseburia sp.]MCM1241697.1 Gldg family protein [Roseburia sp.]
MMAIYKKEIRAFFHSFIGWLFLAVNLFMFGVYFTVYNMISGYPDIAYVLQSVVFLFMILVPVLTMRGFSEERKLKTDQLILTAPVGIGKIVLGKYLALLSVFAIPVVIIGIMPPVLSLFGAFQMGSSYTALCGYFLYGALGLAVGLFLSSLTESIVVSAVLTFVVMFLGYLMSGICSIISQTGNLVTKFLGAFDMVDRFDEMLNGNFYVPSVVYYLSGTFLFLFATVQSIKKRRYSISGSGFKEGLLSLGKIVVAIELTIAVNILAAKLPENMLSIDVTSNRLYTLTDETKEMVSAITEDITLYVLVGEDYKDINLDKTLRKIEELSEHITVTYVDPTVNPYFYSNYSLEEPAANSIIAVGPERSRIIDYDSIYEYEIYSYYEYQITGYDGEGQIVSALAYVTTDEMPKIYVTGGHQELELEERFLQAIQKENIVCEPLSLINVEAVPEDAQALIINAPLNDFSTDDTDKVLAYLEKGGNAVIVPSWTEEELPNFEKILAYYGVEVDKGIIIEGDTDRYYQQIPYLIFPYINETPITDRLLDVAVFSPYAQGLLYGGMEGVYYTPLLETSESSYSKSYEQSELEVASEFKKEEWDSGGPFVIALHAEKTTENDAVSHAVIVGVEFFFTTDADSIVPGNNVKFFGSVLSALTDHENSILIPVKQYTQLLAFSTRTAAIVGVIAIVVIPLCCLLAGLGIWLYRRRK